tara:strand:+ start:347 stop:745 length:399 start_codon:yes stop_codon:yes gene_type:complete
MIKILCYASLLFFNTPRINFQELRNKKNLQGLLVIHHIIPKQCKNHPTIIMSKYDIGNGYNLMFLPTLSGWIKIDNLHSDRPIHFKGYKEYNSYIINLLDEIFLNNQIQEENLCKLNRHLRQNMRHLEIPWN